MDKYRYWGLLDCSSVRTSGLGNKATESEQIDGKTKGHRDEGTSSANWPCCGGTTLSLPTAQAVPLGCTLNHLARITAEQHGMC